MDKIPLWRGDFISVKQLADDFAQYLYLPRLRDADVLLAAIRDGIASITWERETFAYADSYNATNGRYLGLRGGQQIMASLDGLLVKPEVAVAQIAADAAATRPTSPAATAPTASATTQAGGDITYTPTHLDGSAHEPAAPKATPTRFYASKTLDSTRLVRDADEIAKEIVQHLTKLVGSSVEITLEIHATLPEGVSEDTIRTVTENSRTLKFKDFGFEE